MLKKFKKIFFKFPFLFNKNRNFSFQFSSSKVDESSVRIKLVIIFFAKFSYSKTWAFFQEKTKYGATFNIN